MAERRCVMFRTSIVGLALFSLGCTTPEQAGQRDPEFLSSPETEALGLPFSDAVRVGSVL
jgi:hypothetical protein